VHAFSTSPLFVLKKALVVFNEVMSHLYTVEFISLHGPFLRPYQGCRTCHHVNAAFISKTKITAVLQYSSLKQE
jgi:hypothetical protein